MNHSMYSADRATHLKIVVVALVAGIAIAGLGLYSDAASSQAERIVQIGKSTTMISSAALAARQNRGGHHVDVETGRVQSGNRDQQG